jgi:tetratricopeptide (TPR) repeat protein
MYLRALQGYEKALNLERASTYAPSLNTVNNLGLLYADLGRLDEAEKTYQRALEGMGTPSIYQHSTRLTT